MNKSNKNIVFFCIFVLTILTLLHVCQIETYEDFIDPTSTVSPISNEDDETLINAKNELIQKISDKLTIVNDKMNKFDNVKPIQASTYRNLFETDLPAYMNTVRGATATNRHIFDISQGIQNKTITNLTNKYNELNTRVNKDLEGDVPIIKSITSHSDGKNINLIKSGDFHNISLNGGCLFVVNDTTGEVDYDITNYSRNDKNKICLANNPDQQFKLHKVEDVDGYKLLTNSSTNELPHYDNEYPFYLITPKNNEKLCLQTEDDGVSIQPCNLNISQRWKGFQINKTCS